ncbi:hypothetical protein D3C86_1411000 [compost metagenome]
MPTFAPLKLTVAAPVTGLKPSPNTATTSPTAPRLTERPETWGVRRPTFETGSVLPEMKLFTEVVRLLTSAAVRPVRGPT